MKSFMLSSKVEQSSIYKLRVAYYSISQLSSVLSCIILNVIPCAKTSSLDNKEIYRLTQLHSFCNSRSLLPADPPRIWINLSALQRCESALSFWVSFGQHLARRISRVISFKGDYRSLFFVLRDNRRFSASLQLKVGRQNWVIRIFDKGKKSGSESFIFFNLD